LQPIGFGSDGMQRCAGRRSLVRDNPGRASARSREPVAAPVARESRREGKVVDLRHHAESTQAVPRDWGCPLAASESSLLSEAILHLQCHGRPNSISLIAAFAGTLAAAGTAMSIARRRLLQALGHVPRTVFTRNANCVGECEAPRVSLRVVLLERRPRSRYAIGVARRRKSHWARRR